MTVEADPATTATPIDVLVVDDHPVVGAGVSTILSGSRARVVGQAATTEDAVALAAKTQPAIVLLDLRMGDESLSIGAIAPILAAAPAAHLLIFTAFPDHPAVAAALAAGAAGCLVKDTDQTDLVRTIEAIADGEAMERPGRDPLQPTRASLSAREYEILLRVSVGETNAEIARELFLAPNTVKTYWQNALDKLGARNRAEAITKAYRAGLL